MKNRVMQTRTTCLGVGISLLVGGFIASSSWINKLELKLQDFLIQLRSSTITASNNILLVSIDKKFLKNLEFKDNNSQLIYSKLTKWLLEQKAGLVILNLPHDWRIKSNLYRSDIDRKKNQQSKTETSEDFASSIQNLIKENNNQDHIVLVSPTVRISNPYHREIADYTKFVVFGEDLFISQDKILNSLVRVQGFFEYENIEGQNPSDLSSPARRFYSIGTFKKYTDIELKSFAWLGLEKYQNNLQNKHDFIPAKIPSHIQANYWQPSTFESIPIEKLYTGNRETEECEFTKETELLKKIHDKIVIVGLTEGKELDILAMKSPSGEMISGIEVQANLLSSLMTNSYYQIIPKPMIILIYILNAVAISSIMPSCKTRQYIIKYLGFGLLGGYGSLTIVTFWYGWMIPFCSVIITGIATALSIAIYSKNNQLEKDNVRKQIQIAEEEAMTSQAKKLILRIWSDIHDDPLQELKVAMDDIELLDLPNSDSEQILDRLSYVGTEIRKYLDVNPTTELTIQPELRQGLAAAIQKHLQQLTDSGALELKVIFNLQPINEPQLNSNWIDAREDIFRFFREAITNVVRHAQGENSTATQVIVSLSQEAQQCTLVIENDGGVMDTTTDTRKRGGLGRKLMAEMAAVLPDSSWEKVALANGGMRVQLLWQQRF